MRSFDAYRSGAGELAWIVEDGRLQEALGRDAVSVLTRWNGLAEGHDGARVLVQTDQETFEGTTAGLASDGSLRVRREDGRVENLYSGDVSRLRPSEP